MQYDLLIACYLFVLLYLFLQSKTKASLHQYDYEQQNGFFDKVSNAVEGFIGDTVRYAKNVGICTCDCCMSEVQLTGSTCPVPDAIKLLVGPNIDNNNSYN